MIKKDITYSSPFEDAANKTVSETHWFHLSEAEVVRMQLEHVSETPVVDPSTGQELEGLAAKMQRMILDQNGKEIIAIIEEILERSYGVRDGDRFVKSTEIWEKFRSSGAYDVLFLELVTDAEKSADFMNRLLPSDLLAKTQAQIAEAEISKDVGVAADASAPRLITTTEASSMDPSALRKGLADGSIQLS